MARLSRKKKIAIVAAVIVLAGSGAAFAYWTTTGSGTGTADNATSNGTLTLHATFDNGMTPGSSRTVTYTADNAGSSSLFVATITPTVSIDAGHSGCAPTNFTISPTASNTRVAAGATAVAAGTGTLQFLDTDQNQDACKGATVTLTLASN